MTGLLVVAALLIVANGFFVGAEFAVLATRRSRLEQLSGPSRRARTTLWATARLPLMISGCQLGITLCSLGLGALGEPVVARLLVGPLGWVQVPADVLHPLALAIALTLVSALHMLMGEMVPKNLALAGPERAALLLAPPLVGFVRVFRPLIVALTAVATGIVRLLGVQPVSEVGDPQDREGVAALIAESRAEGLLPDERHDLLRGALSFEERTAAAVLLPDSALVTVTAEATPTDIEELTARTGFSRFPVRRSDGELLGYVHLADVIGMGEAARARPVERRWVRAMTTIGVGDLLHDVLAHLRRTGAHLGRVVDPEGRQLGVVALEDVLEELVGEVRDSTQRRG
jgi:CBS domain containing-hemolysin-like protein